MTEQPSTIDTKLAILNSSEPSSCWYCTQQLIYNDGFRHGQHVRLKRAHTERGLPHARGCQTAVQHFLACGGPHCGVFRHLKIQLVQHVLWPGLGGLCTPISPDGRLISAVAVRVPRLTEHGQIGFKSGLKHCFIRTWINTNRMTKVLHCDTSMVHSVFEP